MPYIQKALGHHSPAFTLAVYGHLLPEGDRRAADVLDSASDATVRNPGATTVEGLADTLLDAAVGLHGCTSQLLLLERVLPLSPEAP